MRFDRFVSALAVSNFGEAIQALIGPDGGSWCKQIGKPCHKPSDCPQSCNCNANQQCVGQK